MKDTKKISAILHNIRSLHNVGSMFRTADAAGVEKLFLTGYTPAPIDKFGKTQASVVKTALGAEHTVEWERVKNIKIAIKKLRKEGYSIIALEQGEGSTDYRSHKSHGSVALLVGNEVRGLSSVIIRQCDYRIEIPMYGKKESLNVSVAFGIAVYELLI